MGKRKASVFTVAESVSNWLDASCRIPEHIEAGTENPAPLGASLGIATSYGLDQLTVVPAEANRLTPLPSPLATEPDCGLAGGSRGKAPADVAVPPQTSNENVPASLTSEELGPRTEAVVDAFWALLAELGYEPL